MQFERKNDMAMKKKGNQDVRRYYVQSALSGFGIEAKQEDKSSDSGKTSAAKEVSPFFWQQKEYIVYVPVIIKQTDVSDGKYKYEIRIALDVDVPISPHKPKSKSLTGQVFNLAQETKRDNGRIHLVYGIPDKRGDTLPPTIVDTMDKAIAHVYGRVLGYVARAIECTLHFSGKGQELQTSSDDNGKRASISPTSENLGTDKKSRRSGSIRGKVHAEEEAKTPPILDEKNGSLLGERPGDGQDKLGGIPDDTFEGTGLAGQTLAF